MYDLTRDPPHRPTRALAPPRNGLVAEERKQASELAVLHHIGTPELAWNDGIS